MNMSRIQNLTKLFLVEGYKKKPLVLFFNRKLLPLFSTISKTKLSESHWHVIEQHLPKNFRTVLDIGAGRGFFSFKMAELGKNVTAIESKQRRIKIIESLNNLMGYNLKTKLMLINKKNIEELEKADVTLFISVWHQMVVYQPEEAEEILHKLWGKTEKCMFFAIADGRSGYDKYREAMTFLGIEKEEIRQNITALLGKLENSTVTFLTDLEYFGDTSLRMFFKIERNIGSVNRMEFDTILNEE